MATKKKQEINVGDVISVEQKAVIDIAKMLTDGASRKEIREMLDKQYGLVIYHKENINGWINKALDYIFPKGGYLVDKEKYLKINFLRLSTITEKAMQDPSNRQLKTAIAAIQEMNKMLGIGNGTQVLLQQDLDNKTQQVVIKFDG